MKNYSIAIGRERLKALRFTLGAMDAHRVVLYCNDVKIGWIHVGDEVFYPAKTFGHVSLEKEFDVVRSGIMGEE